MKNNKPKNIKLSDNFFGSNAFSLNTDLDIEEQNDSYKSFNNLFDSIGNGNGKAQLNRAPGSGKPKPPLTDSPPSDLFGEISSSLSSSNTPPSSEDLYQDIGSISNSDPIFYDSPSQQLGGIGVIGGELKAVHSNID